jgi:hypothetical protein
MVRIPKKSLAIAFCGLVEAASILQQISEILVSGPEIVLGR